MVQNNNTNGGYAYLIDWIVYLIDIALINGFLFIVYKLIYINSISSVLITLDKSLEAFIIINLTYFVTSLFVRCDLASNFITADKVVQQSVYFISLYAIILTACFTLSEIVVLPFLYWIGLFFTLAILFSLWHLLFRLIIKTYRKKGYNYKSILIIGGGITASETYKELKSVYNGYKILGFFDKESNKNNMPNYLGDIDDVEKYIESHAIDEIFCTLPASQNEKIANIISTCEKKMIRFHLVPDLYMYVKKKLSLQFLEAIPILSLRLEPLQHPFNRLKKRAMDVLIASLAIIFTYPVIYLIIAPIIKLTSPGPLHFTQKRTGIQGKEFNCIKLRSMKVNGDANKKSATKGDSRITKIGAFIRKTSIDEFPQFINVLKGEMSVVGPRPHMLAHTEEHAKQIERFMVRHLVKPGITGWAQVTGSRGEIRSPEEMAERVKKDVWYIENWSLFLDLKIIVKTGLNIFMKEDRAY